MKPFVVALGATTLAAAASGVSAAQPTSFDWQIVVNNGFAIADAVDPDAGDRFYNSYNPPSVNSDALVVFRAGWLAITASMGVEEAGWAGIYLTQMPVPFGPGK